MPKFSAPKRVSQKSKDDIVTKVVDVPQETAETVVPDNDTSQESVVTDAKGEDTAGNIDATITEEINSAEAVSSTKDPLDTFGEGSSDVPKVDIDAPLNIEGLTSDKDIPVIDKSAKLKFEDEQKDVDLGEEKANKGLLLFGMIGVLLTLGALVGFYFMFVKAKTQEVSLMQPQVTNNKSQEASPNAAINKGEWTLEVLNGSGVAGAAKIAALKLEDSGYKVVKTGNADRDNYEKTTLFVAASVKDKESLVLGDLKELLGSVESGGELLDSTASARLVVGKD